MESLKRYTGDHNAYGEKSWHILYAANLVYTKRFPWGRGSDGWYRWSDWGDEVFDAGSGHGRFAGAIFDDGSGYGGGLHVYDSDSKFRSIESRLWDDVIIDRYYAHDYRP